MLAKLSCAAETVKANNTPVISIRQNKLTKIIGHKVRVKGTNMAEKKVLKCMQDGITNVYWTVHLCNN